MIWGINNVQPQKDFANNSSYRDVDLPALVAFDASNNSAAATNRGVAAAKQAISVSYLNVVKDFYWTYSKPESRQEVPTIFLREKKLKVNALVSQLKYSLGLAPQEATKAIEALRSGAAAIPGAEWLYKNVMAPVFQGAQTAVSTAAPYIDKLSELIAEDNNATLRTSPWLRPYLGLYITEDTGWEFLFPYFEDRYEAQGNAFSNEGATNALSNIIGTAVNIPMEIAEISGALQQPKQITYIERAKFYNFPTDGEEVSFSFPLINTGSVSFDDVVNNWQLLFLLLYNNKPGRLSPTQIEQPVIYEVEIPGVKYLPFCYVTGIDIKFQGSRRTLTIPVNINEQQPLPGQNGDILSVSNATGTRAINTIIPDAYMVTINLKSMLGGTKNFMYHLIDKSDRTRVGVRTALPVQPITPGTSPNTSSNAATFTGDINTQSNVGSIAQ